jgi:hypothetical protein
MQRNPSGRISIEEMRAASPDLPWTHRHIDRGK